VAVECASVQEWIEEEISKPVDEWVEKTEEKCKKRHWYDPRSWFCWLVTWLVKVVVWVVVKVGKWVVREVCKVVGAIVGFFRDFFVGLWNILAGIFTWDWCRALHGLIQAGAGIIDSALTIARVLVLLDTLDYIITERQRGQLKTYIRTKLSFKYSGQDFQDIIANLGIDRGAFGYRIPMRAIRTFLDSETPSPDEPGVPNLVRLNEQKKINLREFCGFEFTEGCFNRKRYKTLKKGLHAGGGGMGEIDDPITEAELNTYLSSRGAEGPKFFVLCMRDGVLRTKLKAAEMKGRELGLMPQWSEEDQEVKLPKHITHEGGTVQEQTKNLVEFLIDPIKRKPKIADDPTTPMDETDVTAALGDLCTPVAVGIFQYDKRVSLRGLSACLQGSACKPPVGSHRASGVTFIDNKPDIAWKYVPIHELGHYFGLCHVAGLDRIMYTPKAPPGEPNNWWETVKRSFNWYTLPKLLFTKGEPSFTLDEAMQAWDYIIEHFPPTCLGVKSDGPVIL
jgi:hypothetical protein